VLVDEFDLSHLHDDMMKNNQNFVTVAIHHKKSLKLVGFATHNKTTQSTYKTFAVKTQSDWGKFKLFFKQNIPVME